MAGVPDDPNHLLSQPDGGEARLVELLYGELHALARNRMAAEASGHTLQTTALVHEAWLRLSGPEGDQPDWEGRAHFFGAAAIAMRRILIERSRRVNREKNGGLHSRVPLKALPLDAVGQDFDPRGLDFEALDLALERLGDRDERAAKVIELRFYAGLSVEDTALAMCLSERTVAREWNVARAFIAREMGRE